MTGVQTCALPIYVRTSLEKLAVVKQNSVLIANDDKKLSALFELISKEKLIILKITVEKNSKNILRTSRQSTGYRFA